jgi:hypothetical protein
MCPRSYEDRGFQIPGAGDQSLIWGGGWTSNNTGTEQYSCVYVCARARGGMLFFPLPKHSSQVFETTLSNSGVLFLTSKEDYILQVEENVRYITQNIRHLHFWKCFPSCIVMELSRNLLLCGDDSLFYDSVSS